jgi:hypothetical protein
MTVYGTAKYDGTTYTLYGQPGSTFIDELNRLANGGEYPDRSIYLEEAGAANKWAGTFGKQTVGALNYKFSPTRKPPAFVDIPKVCNQLAGFSNNPAKSEEAVTALRTIAS